LRRMRQTRVWGICSSWLARYVDCWGPLTNVSRTRWIVSVDGPGRPDHFAAHRQPLCWNFTYHSRILSVGGSMWYMARNLCCAVIIDSVWENSKRHNAFLFPVHAMCRHDCPLEVKPVDTLHSPLSVLCVAHPSSEVPEGLRNYPVVIPSAFMLQLLLLF
jgi:hypothetical protein